MKIKKQVFSIKPSWKWQEFFTKCIFTRALGVAPFNFLFNNLSRTRASSLSRRRFIMKGYYMSDKSLFMCM